MTSCMTLKTVIMATRTKLLFVADIHTNACTSIIYNENIYKCRSQFLWFSLSGFIHTNNIQTCAYVYSQWWYCADRSYAFLNMGGVRSRRYCASISDMTATWGLRREVVLRINYPEHQYTPNYVGSEPSWSNGLKPPNFGIPHLFCLQWQFWQVSCGLNLII